MRSWNTLTICYVNLHSDLVTMHSCNVASTSPKLATACHAMRTYW